VGKENVDRSWVPFQWTSLLIASIVVLSGAGAFAAVRVWFAPAAAMPAAATLTVDTQPAGADLQIDQPPRLSIFTDPSGALVSIDGQPRGVSPLFVEDLTPAEHIVSVTSGTASARRAVTVTAGVTKELMFSLPRSTAPLAGWMAVASPFPVEVIESDEMVGTSGAAKIMLAAGKHALVLRNQTFGYEEARTIDIVPGAVASVTVIPPMGRLNVNARPWADVLIDGVVAGQTPLANIEIAAGPHEITFRHPQLGERTERIVITATGVNRSAVDLGR